MGAQRRRRRRAGASRDTPHLSPRPSRILSPRHPHIVVGAQNRSNLCIWYHIDTPERVTVVPIKGDVEEIERGGGSTQVVVDEGMNTVSYELNEALISFGSAMEDGDLQGAANMLERLPLSPETEAMWEQLSALALQV